MARYGNKAAMGGMTDTLLQTLITLSAENNLLTQSLIAEVHATHALLQSLREGILVLAVVILLARLVKWRLVRYD